MTRRISVSLKGNGAAMRYLIAVMLGAVLAGLVTITPSEAATTTLTPTRTTETTTAPDGEVVTMIQSTVDVPTDSTLTDAQVYAALDPTGTEARGPGGTGTSKTYHTYWRQDVCVGMWNGCSVVGAGPGWWHLHHQGNYYRTGSGGKAWVSDPPSGRTSKGGHACHFDSSGAYSISNITCTVYDPSDPAGYGYAYSAVRSKMEWTVCIAVSGGPACNGGWWARALQWPDGTVTKQKNF